MEYLTDVFLNCSNSQFRLYVQQLKDFHPNDIDTPEKLFSKVQSYYHELLTKPGKVWLPIKKRRSTFVVNDSYGDDKSLHSYQTQKSSKAVIDRTPPGRDDPRTRTNEKTGCEEHWCGKCPKGGRWGNHLSSGHDKWYEDFLAYKKKKKQDSDPSDESASRRSSSQSGNNGGESVASQPPAPMRSVTVSSSSPMRSLLRRSYVSFNDSDDDEEVI